MRIVLDITTSSRWKSADVGITRVERQFALSLLKNPPDGVIVEFVERDRKGAFVSLRPDAARAALGTFLRGGPGPGPNSEAPPTSRPGDRVLREAKQIGRQAFYRSQQVFPAAAHADFEALAVHSERFTKHLVHAVRHRKPEAVPGEDRPCDGVAGGGWSGIGPDDVYVSMGLDWDDKSLLELFRLKSRFRFRSVHMVYDLIPTTYPQWLPSAPDVYDRYFTDLLFVADRLVCISETTRRDIVSFAERNDLPSPTSQVVYLGADLDEVVPTPVPSLQGKRFVIFVSTIEPRKNHRFLLELWKRMSEDRDVPQLVIVGRPGWNCHELLTEMDQTDSLREHVLRLEHVSDGELRWLYQECLFTVYPSLYEGWGLPVVESLLHGKLCVASTAGAVVEAGHGLAIHCDTFDGPGWRSLVEELLDDPEFRLRAEERIRVVLPTLAKSLSWSSFGARMTEAILAAGDVR